MTSEQITLIIAAVTAVTAFIAARATNNTAATTSFAELVKALETRLASATTEMQRLEERLHIASRAINERDKRISDLELRVKHLEDVLRRHKIDPDNIEGAGI